MNSSVSAVLDKAKTTCSQQGVKLTEKRENVLSCIIQSGIAVSPYELADLYRQQFGQSIPAMSVYRILDFLVELSLVHKLSSANKYIACTHITCCESHKTPQFLICENCQAVTEVAITDSTMAELKQSVSDTGFVLTTEQIELRGLCKNCQ